MPPVPVEVLDVVVAPPVPPVPPPPLVEVLDVVVAPPVPLVVLAVDEVVEDVVAPPPPTLEVLLVVPEVELVALVVPFPPPPVPMVPVLEEPQPSAAATPNKIKERAIDRDITTSGRTETKQGRPRHTTGKPNRNISEGPVFREARILRPASSPLRSPSDHGRSRGRRA
jgi:hypothetical protein